MSKSKSKRSNKKAFVWVDDNFNRAAGLKSKATFADVKKAIKKLHGNQVRWVIYASGSGWSYRRI